MGLTMSLAGTFDGNDFAEVLELLTRRTCTGRLQVRAASLNASIHLSRGAAVGVDIVVAGWRDARTDLASELEEVCLQALRSPRGTFEFQAGEVAPDDDRETLDLARAVAAARGRMEEWEQVQAVIPSLSAVPHISEDLIEEKIVLSREQWRVIAMIDGRRSVNGLARRMDLAPLRLCQILEPLVRDGAVAMEGAESHSLSPCPPAKVSIDPSRYAHEGTDGRWGGPSDGGRSTTIPGFRVVPPNVERSLGVAPAS